MINDCSYQNHPFSLNEKDHSYGPQVHILSHPFAITLLSKFCSPETKLPFLNDLVTRLYQVMAEVVISREFPLATQTLKTRMPNSSHQISTLSPKTKVVCVDVARAGILPSHTLFEELLYFLDEEGVRQDHFSINRETNASGEVIGVKASGAKIGGPVDNCFVLIPDPMGATGSSLSYVLDHYKNHVSGKAKKYISLHLIITPEFVKQMHEAHPDLEIYALRLDRGLSSPKVLQEKLGNPGEKGLNEVQYIVPGAGGVGEILNNSFV